jgi:hypothetical protein
MCKIGATYIVRKAGNYCDPDLIRTDWEVRVRCDQEVMEKSHVCHSLHRLSGCCLADSRPGLLTNVPGVDCNCTIPTGLGDVYDLCID